MKLKMPLNYVRGIFYSNMFLVYRYVLLNLLQVMCHRVVVLYHHVVLMLCYRGRFE